MVPIVAVTFSPKESRPYPYMPTAIDGNRYKNRAAIDAVSAYAISVAHPLAGSTDSGYFSR